MGKLGFGVLTVADTETNVFWDLKPCSFVDINISDEPVVSSSGLQIFHRANVSSTFLTAFHGTCLHGLTPQKITILIFFSPSAACLCVSCSLPWFRNGHFFPVCDLLAPRSTPQPGGPETTLHPTPTL